MPGYKLSIPVCLRGGCESTVIAVPYSVDGIKLSCWWDAASLSEKAAFIDSIENNDAIAAYKTKVAADMGMSAGSDILSQQGGVPGISSDTENPNSNHPGENVDPDYSQNRGRDVRSTAQLAQRMNETFDQTSPMSTGTTNP